jgi:predicted GTPase
MSNLCKQIEEGIKILPQKDYSLCKKFLKERDFVSIMDIVDSCLYMKRKDLTKEIHKEKWEKIDVGSLEKLSDKIKDYVSILGVSNDFIQDDLDDYY